MACRPTFNFPLSPLFVTSRYGKAGKFANEGDGDGGGMPLPGRVWNLKRRTPKFFTKVSTQWCIFLGKDLPEMRQTERGQPCGFHALPAPEIYTSE